MNLHANQNTVGHKNPVAEARAQLALSQDELADKLNTSLYALTRWERGDIEVSQDILDRLHRLMNPSAIGVAETSAREHEVNFASNGLRSKNKSLLLCDRTKISTLKEPRSSLLEHIFQDQLWGGSHLALGDILERRQDYASTRDLALDEEISAGKNTYTYDAHTYHTKVPPQGIANVIARYLPQGGVILDPFAGSGMTGVAARYLGHDVVLNELSPSASFIAHNFTRTVDTAEYNAAISHVLDQVSELRKQLYTTECRECGKDAELIFTVWSYELECKHCDHPFVLWDHSRKYGNNIKEHKFLRKFPCPSCGEEVNKSYLKESSPYLFLLVISAVQKKLSNNHLTKMMFNASKLLKIESRI